MRDGSGEDGGRSGSGAEADPGRGWHRLLRRRKKPRKTLWDNTRETLDSILIALVLASVFRTFIMEAFEIPTGSMAPTLYGRHVDVTCSRCGWLYSVGADRQSEEEGERVPDQPVCPRCGSINRLPREVRRGIGGDRILVDKGAYTLNDPKRWDVGVFVNPHNDSENYIKRIVGLPGETVLIRNGDLYIDGRIAAKPPGVQAVLWMSVFDSRFPPNGSWTNPWSEGAPLSDLTVHTGRTAYGPEAWAAPWRRLGEVGTWDLSGKAFDYEPDRSDTPGGDRRPSMIQFAWKVFDTYAYGQRDRRGPHDPLEEVGDVRLRAEVTLRAPGVILATIVEDDRRIDYQLSGDPAVPSEVRINGRRALWEVGSRTEPLLRPGRTARVAFVNVDDRAWMEVDGAQPLGAVPYSDWESASRAEEGPAKVIRLGAAGGGVRFENVAVDRDIFYTKTMEPEDAYGVAAPARLGRGEYFVLGDNSPNSRDSRRWWHLTSHPSPVVPREYFIGKALVLYWPHKEKLWRIGFIR